jgi:hypothetical protein
VIQMTVTIVTSMILVVNVEESNNIDKSVNYVGLKCNPDTCAPFFSIKGYMWY